MKWFLIVLVIVSSGFFFLFPKKEKTIVVAVSANAQYAMQELKTYYENQTKVRVDLVKGASGKLTTQIIEGADYDLFLSADTSYTYKLYKEGLTVERPFIYGYGSLVLWSMENNFTTLDSLLLSTDKIAIANPTLAPYGKAALEMLYHSHLFDKVESKIVYGESLSQVNHYFTSGAADACITSRSLMVSVETKGKGKWIELDSTTYSPIAQAVVLVKNNNGSLNPEAEKFYRFLSSDKAKNIFRKYGYKI